MALVTTREGTTTMREEQVGEFAEGVHTLSVAGRKRIDPQRWRPMAPGSWEQGTTLLPGESALEVIQQVEKEMAAEQGVGGASEPSVLLSPAARDMIIQSEARIAQIEGRPPPKPPHDELAELLALRAEQDALARASKAAKKARESSDAALPPTESAAAKRLRRARFCVDPLWWLSALCCRCRAAIRCPKLYDIDTLERLGPNSLDTGDVLLISPANTGMAQLFSSSRWVHVGLVVRAPPRRFVTWQPTEKVLRQQLDGGYVAGDVTDGDESMDEEGNDAGWEVERADRSRLYVYEAVADTADRRFKDRGGPQLVPLRHRLRNCPAHSTAAIRHLSDCERSEARLDGLWDLMHRNVRRPFRHPWPVAPPPEEEDEFAYLDEEKVKEMEATRPIHAAELVAEAYQAMMILPEYRPNETESEAAERFAQGEVGCNPAEYVCADWGENGVLRRWVCGAYRPLFSVFNACCCCLSGCCTRDIADTFSRLGPPEPVPPPADADPDYEEAPVRPRLAWLPELGPELQLSNTSELTSLLDVEARSHGKGGKRLLHMFYGCCVVALLYQAATGTGFDAAAASVVVALGGGVCMATIGLFWDWATPIIWPNLATERGSVHVYRGAAGLYGLHVQIGHALVSALIITLLFGVLVDDLAVVFRLNRDGNTAGIGVGLAMMVCVGGALPTIVLQVALLQTSWHQGASWLVQALLQYAAGGAFIGQFYFTPDCTPNC